jgi:hypothetical protein
MLFRRHGHFRIGADRTPALDRFPWAQREAVFVSREDIAFSLRPFFMMKLTFSRRAYADFALWDRGNV